MVVAFPEPYQVVIFLPSDFDVRNRLIGMINPSDAVVTEEKEGNLMIAWNATRSAELRFYSPDRVVWLTWFGQFWIIVAIVLILPFFLSRKRG
jgi:hypothetical protein